MSVCCCDVYLHVIIRHAKKLLILCDDHLLKRIIPEFKIALKVFQWYDNRLVRIPVSLLIFVYNIWENKEWSA